MDPCMGALPDTSAPAYRHQSRTEDRKTEQGKRRKGTGNNVTRKWGRNLFLNPQRKKEKKKESCRQDRQRNYREQCGTVFSFGHKASATTQDGSAYTAGCRPLSV